MKKKYYWIIGIAFILLIAVGVVWFSYETKFLCPEGQIRGLDCTDPVAGAGYVCYEPKQDAGKECSSSKDCSGACVADSIDNCKIINKEFFFYLIAICDSSIKGKCSAYRSGDVTNEILKYSDIPNYSLSQMTEYNLTENNKIIVKMLLHCV